MVISGVDIAVKKSKRKTVSIFVERDGSVSALVPSNLSDDEIATILKAKEYQIHRNLAQWLKLNERYVTREYVNGQSFLYLGRNYRLKLVDDKLGELKFYKGYFLLSKDELSNAEQYFIDFYRNKLKQKIKPLIIRYKEQLGVSPNDVKVMELKNRWASCSAKGNINFHWKCAMAPMDVLQYIIVHELAHLIHLNHTTEFWNEVDKVLPKHEEQMNWLKLNGVGMSL
jgi:predicted metal-dependent hydrolase|tara:strand:+ start:619 stop:1299 length:681 start_codon:yes stop_codon:yes gene_type:complete